MTPPKGQRLGGRGKPPEPTSTRTDPPAPSAPEAPRDDTTQDATQSLSNGALPPRQGDDHGAPPEPAYEAPPDPIALMPAHLRRGAEMAGRAYLSARQKAAARWVDWAHAVAALRAGGVPEGAIALLAAQAGVPVPEPSAVRVNGGPTA